ncbi:MAG: DUF1549 domain-containing protein [bacterium]|nr:DUF1549 domain-containing protein [bacterium]
MMKSTNILRVALLLNACLLNSIRAAEDTPHAASENSISYSEQIEPIFRTHCQGCHQPAKAQGDYVMTDFASLLRAGESGSPAVVPGDPDASYLLEQVTPVNGESAMPKKGQPLADAEIELIRQWIQQGAVDDSPSAGPRYSEEQPPTYARAPVVTSIAYSPDGRWLASSGFQEVFLIDTANWTTHRRLVGLSERIESLAFSPDSQRLLVTGGAPGRWGEVQVWNVESGELELSKRFGFDTIYGGCFSPDGKLIAFAASDNVVRAIDSSSGEQRLHQGAHEDWVLACVFNPDGKHLLSAGRDMTVKLTEVETERFVDNVTSITPGALRGGINALAMHPARDEVLVGGADGIPKVYRIFRETERRIGDDANLIREFPNTGGRIFDVAISRDGKYLAVVSTLDGESRVAVYPYDFDGKLPDNIKEIMKKRVAERKAEEQQAVVDYTHDVRDAVLDISLQACSLYALAFSPDSQHLVVGGSDGKLRVLSVASGSAVQDFVPITLEADSAGEDGATERLLAGSGMPLPTNAVPDADAERELLPRAKLLQLSVQPEQITFSSAFDYAQLVVTASYSNGQTCDVTRLCQTKSRQEFVSVSPLGLVRPESEGAAEIEIRFSGQALSIPVQVQGLNQPKSVDFLRDVNPILSRLGCNSGTCHGAQKGKNGFKLSLRGYDPLEDIRALSDDLSARRLNTSAPDASLMLLKPIGMVPHEGGVLMDTESIHYAVLRSWIAEGARFDRSSRKVTSIQITPEKPVIEREGGWQQFRVLANYHDGTQRDVTQEAFVESGNTEICQHYPDGRVQAVRRGEAPILVRYEGAYSAATVTVMGDRKGFEWEQPESYSTIDRLVANKWQRMKILPSQVADDNTFLRRLRLDLTGLPPTAAELRDFLDDPRPSRLKRQAKVDELIGSEDFVEHWTNKWADLLQVNSKFLGSEGAKAFRDWIRNSVAENQPYDAFARDVLTASGSNKQHPAASYFKILRDPDLMMENTTHLFLAIRFNCNKCHDHPFERWTQDQYYELAAYFAQTKLKRDPASGDKNIGGTAVEGAKPLYEEVYDAAEGEMLHVRTNQAVAPSFPFDCKFDVPEQATRREQLAAWLTSPDNPYFAKSFVNRLWGYLTGTGLVEPLDDIRAGNPPTNPELLEHLTQEFVQSGFDTQHVLRLICNSRTYQLSVASHEWNSDDNLNYSHAKARRLPAEVLYDAVYQVTGAVSEIPGVEPGTRAAALPDVAVQLPDGFLNNLGRPVRESACECERSQDLQLGPVMALVSGPTIGKAISDPQCDLAELAGGEASDAELIREIYLRVLSREPSADELTAVLSTADQIAIDHEHLKQELAAREEWWQSERAKLEDQRLAELEATKKQIQDRKIAMAPEREKLEQARLEQLAQAESSLAAYRESATELAQTYLRQQHPKSNWFTLAPSKLSATSKDRFFPQSDRSIIVKGEGAKGTYNLSFKTPLRGITGFRLEALPLAGIEGGGPGLPGNGNFVLTEIELSAKPLQGEAKADKVTIAKGQADFTQEGFDVAQVFDGNTRDQRGWAISPRGGVVHWAVFELSKPIDLEGGVELEFKLHQFHNADKHRLAHFRISVTTDEGEIHLGLPESFAALQIIPKADRGAEELDALLSYLQKSDSKWLELQQAVAQAKKPLPEDAELVGLQTRQKLLEVETPDDPQLVQLRADVAASQQQVQNRRLTLAQDLTWALINSPAFIFNH